MKRIVIFVVFLLTLTFCNSVFAMEDSEVVDSFKQYVDNVMTQVTPTYEGTHYGLTNSSETGGWYKSIKYLEPGYKIDVEKTNSLISPYVGTLEVSTKTVFYEHNPNKGIASESEIINFTSSSTYKFTIAYQNDNWVVTSAKEYDHFLDKIYDSSTDIIKTLSCDDEIRN